MSGRTTTRWLFYRDFIGSPLGVAAPAEAGISTPADLKCKVIGVSALSAIESALAKGLAAGAGLDPETDIELRAVGARGQGVVALEGGDIGCLCRRHRGHRDHQRSRHRYADGHAPKRAGRPHARNGGDQDYIEANPEVIENSPRPSRRRSSTSAPMRTGSWS